MQEENAPDKLTWTSPRLRLRVLFTTFLFAFICYGFFNWVLWPVKVSGTSMLPNYQDGSRHFINKLAYWSAKPQRGDVVGVLERGLVPGHRRGLAAGVGSREEDRLDQSEVAFGLHPVHQDRADHAAPTDQANTLHRKISLARGTRI